MTLAFLLMIFLLLFVYNEDEFNKCFGNFPQKDAPKNLEEMGMSDTDLVEKETAGAVEEEVPVEETSVETEEAEEETSKEEETEE